jgi:hypothetical protein
MKTELPPAQAEQTRNSSDKMLEYLKREIDAINRARDAADAQLVTLHRMRDALLHYRSQDK